MKTYCLLIGTMFCSFVASAQSGLQVSYGVKGVSQISYNGILLEDSNANPADQFHIWHMKATDLSGQTLTNGQYGWGENNNGTSWNAATLTETYRFSWGTIATQFIQQGDTLNLLVTETNSSGSAIAFDGAEIYPFALHFPQMPAKFGGYNQYAITTTGPGVSVADYGSGVVTSVVPNANISMYGGWKSVSGSTYTPLMTTTAPDGLPNFLPRNDQPVQPGNSLSYTLSLRFTPEAIAADTSDATSSFAAKYPSQMTWNDRRIIGSAYLASSPSNPDITQPGGFPTNPRRYFNDPSVDITSDAGVRTFQQRMLAQARENVATAAGLNSQGVITWDFEGEQYPQNTTYVCSPDQIAAIAPEMEMPVRDSSSPYFGQRLDDAYFKTMTGAGLKVGVCLRPQVFTLASNGTASQVFLNSNAAVIANLENKAKYANTRWGVTMFYVDSAVDATGGALDPAIFQQLITDMPFFLFIPEESTPRDYAYSAPFYSFLFHTDLGTPADILKVYPRAFGVNLVNDVSPVTLATYTPQLTAQVRQGDILMGHGDFWEANDPTLVAIYAAAGVTGNSPTSSKSNPLVGWNTPGPLVYGTALSGSQLNATANIAGSFSYVPAAGTILGAGSNTLTATFTPADSTSYKPVTTTTTLAVTRAVPTLSWSNPPSISAGTALSGAQLNATASVAGAYSYSPAAGFLPAVGVTSLSVIFTPTDAANYSSSSLAVSLQVNAAQLKTPQISWVVPGSVPYGTALSAAQLNASANTPGTFSYSPAAGSIPGAGTDLLTVTFSPNDTATYKSITSTNALRVTQALPVVTWTASQTVTEGAALTSAQLNALANVPGTFTYTPAAGTVLSVGTYTLHAVFTPADQVNYASQTVTALLTASPLVSPNVNLAITSPSVDKAVSGQVQIAGLVNLFLDSTGTFLMVDGQEAGTQRVTSAPWLYNLDTGSLSNGPHLLQLWAHDIGNNVALSSVVSINVAN